MMDVLRKVAALYLTGLMSADRSFIRDQTGDLDPNKSWESRPREKVRQYKKQER
jgi:hypothetical protein